MANPVLVEVIRGDGVESRHRGSFAVMDGTGKLVAGQGDLDIPVFPRSAIKPLQALPLIESGAADRFGLGLDELALACASHSGDPAQVERVERWLERLGLSADDLECGAHPPRHANDTAALVHAGKQPGRSHNNCSGKHAGFLSTALHLGEPSQGYSRADHPVQQRLRDLLSDLGQVDLSATPHGIDGCGIPVLAMPLAAMARALARMANPDSLPAPRASAARRIIAAMTSHPEMVGGSGCFDTRMIGAAKGSFVVKTGAEGVYAGILPRLGLGIALKIDDGATRAAEVLMASLLDHYGELSHDPKLAAEVLEPAIHNAAGDPVGMVCSVVDWPE